jgi:hypothetical protein
MVPLACGIHHEDCLSGHRAQSTAAPLPHGKAGESLMTEEGWSAFTEAKSTLLRWREGCREKFPASVAQSIVWPLRPKVSVAP